MFVGFHFGASVDGSRAVSLGFVVVVSRLRFFCVLVGFVVVVLRLFVVFVGLIQVHDFGHGRAIFAMMTARAHHV